MFGFGKKKITPDEAAMAFLDACADESERAYGLWIQGLAVALELTGGSIEPVKSRVEESGDSWPAYVGAVTAVALPPAKETFGDRASQAIHASVHRDLSLFSAEHSWFPDYVFAILLDEEAKGAARGTIAVRHWARRVGIEQMAEMEPIFRSGFFLPNLAENIALAALGDFWRQLGRRYVVAIPR